MVHKVYTPEHPDPKAVKRVLHPVPVPDSCEYCGSPVAIKSHKQLYGMDYSDWPWALACTGCDARVGLHPGTGIPLGSMACGTLRRARMRAKAALTPMFAGMSKTTAYQWLACQLGLAPQDCHVGHFTELQCDKTVEVCEAYQTSKRLLQDSYKEKTYGPSTRDYIRKREHVGRRA